ncbi:hypothetical protein HHK36_004749 [Tetracentron sinense]|uniref:non-specific serine/threonine protein kinase n=1 Tax=Tetracentron sinense TaxID=13715 RepID=A0A834ZKG2_TETSI|nr:hypothetical protein HHK36_004749 [Tetracentron sinense]
MTDLRISELSNVSSSLEFIKDMMDLRNLDLSFNNLTGPIPSSLINLVYLSHLFLGNNSLSGTLPSQKSPTLLNIDLSYNELSGIFPSWVTPNSQCVLPDANFSIKCGGKDMRSSEGVMFEAENSTLGPASYYLVNSDKWAVSNVGLFADRSRVAYIDTTFAQIDNTLNSEFFQTSRLSPGSLRYYGLGLQNGFYTVNLYFAETRFDDRSSLTWQSLGRRVFDIYIQGNLQLKDFDIRKEAGGDSNRAIQKNFTVNVSENYLEIHLFWAGKGTCCIPEQGYYGPLISAISVIPDFQPTVTGLPRTRASKKKNKTGLIVGIVVSVGVVSFILIFALFYLRRKRSHSKEEEELQAIGARPNMFSYAELRTATEGFNPENKLGEGGFGPVYKVSFIQGILLDRRVVAVKKLSVASLQGKSQFIAEIATISAVQHRNLVKLYGCCIKGRKKLLAWSLHENNRSLELVDPTLTVFDEGEAIRVLGVALLCTQAVPSLRPPMSRIVAMLSGDIDVITVTSRPGYLTDWQFNDITSSSSGQDGIPISLASRSTNSLFDTSTVPNNVVDPIPSPVNITEPMLRNILGQGR